MAFPLLSLDTDGLFKRSEKEKKRRHQKIKEKEKKLRHQKIKETYGDRFQELIDATDGAVQEKVYSIYEDAMKGEEYPGLWDAAQRAASTDRSGRIQVEVFWWEYNQTADYLTGIRNVWMQFWQEQVVRRSAQGLLGDRQWIGNVVPQNVTDSFDHKLKALDQANLLQKAVMYAAFSTVPGFLPVMLTDDEEDVAKYSREQVWGLISANKSVRNVLATLSFSIPASNKETFELKLKVHKEAGRKEPALPQNAVYWARLVGQYLLDALAGPGDTIIGHAGPDWHATTIFDVGKATRLWDHPRLSL